MTTENQTFLLKYGQYYVSCECKGNLVDYSLHIEKATRFTMDQITEIQTRKPDYEIVPAPVQYISELGHVLPVTYFKITNKEPAATTSLFTILKYIQLGRWADKLTDFKENRIPKHFIPSFVPSGAYNVELFGKPENRFTDTCLRNYGTSNNIICIDFDHVENLYALKMECREIPFVVAYFVSPSGNGLKVFVLVKTVGNTLEDFKSVWQQTADYMNKRVEKYGKLNADPKCKNIGRVCYVSNDEHLYLNPAPVPFQVDPDIRETPTPPKPRVRTGTIPINDPTEYLITHTEGRHGTYVKGNRNHFVFMLACNCNKYGLDYDKAFEICEMLYNSDPSEWPHKSFENVVKGAYKNTNDHGKLKLPTQKQAA